MNWNRHIQTFEKYDEADDEFEFDFNSELSPKSQETEDDDEVKVAFEHLASTIRQMIRNSGVKNYTVTVHDKDFVMEFILEQDRKFSTFASLIGLMKKIHKDILVSYEPSVDLWYTKSNKPFLTVDFYYKESGSKKSFDYGDDFPF